MTKMYDRIIESAISLIKDQLMYEYDGDATEVLGELSCIGEALDVCGCGKFIKEIEFQIKELADKEDRCPNCFNETDVETEEEVHYHLDDQPVECFSYSKCHSCGWDSHNC